jgi:hypothetical protein
MQRRKERDISGTSLENMQAVVSAIAGGADVNVNVNANAEAHSDRTAMHKAAIFGRSHVTSRHVTSRHVTSRHVTSHH